MIAKYAGTTIAAMMLAAAAQATVLFDNFGPGDTYDFGIGWTIGDTADWQLGAGFVMNAGGSYSLDSVTASIRHIAGPNFVTLSVYDTVGGLPGSLLETSSAMNLPAHDGTPAPPTVFAFSGSTVLQDGQTYWVIASTDGPAGAWLAWNWNIAHALGLHAQRQGAGPWQVFTFEQSVLRVEGTLVPAPGALALLGLGLLRTRRRRH
jgi:MYXO-CTERM domain-containing protein